MLVQDKMFSTQQVDADGVGCDHWKLFIVGWLDPKQFIPFEISP